MRWRGATVPRGPSARPSAVGARLPAGLGGGAGVVPVSWSVPRFVPGIKTGCSGNVPLVIFFIQTN